MRPLAQALLRLLAATAPFLAASVDKSALLAELPALVAAGAVTAAQVFSTIEAITTARVSAENGAFVCVVA